MQTTDLHLLKSLRAKQSLVLAHKLRLLLVACKYEQNSLHQYHFFNLDKLTCGNLISIDPAR